MANSLLDFVMSVVRDPDTAARFAADPDQAIADADLTNVTSADVEALIPVVTESMSSLVTDMPAVAGLDGLGEAATNVWASGAATAACACTTGTQANGNNAVEIAKDRTVARR